MPFAILSKAWTICKKWSSFFVYNIAIFFVIYYLFTQFSIEIDSESFDDFKNKAELLSWFFASIMSLIAILIAYIVFVFENKLTAASLKLREFYRPYSMDLEGIRSSLTNYRSLIVKDKSLNFIYYALIVVAFFSSISWAVIVFIYTDFDFKIVTDFTLENVVDASLYAFWVIIYLFMTSILYAVNLIRFNKDPVFKGYLPNNKQLYDVDYLVKQNLDMEEILFKLCPKLELFENPEYGGENTYELNVYFPIDLKNLRYVYKVFDKGDVVFKCFGYNNKSSVDGAHRRNSLAFKGEYYKYLNKETTYGQVKFYGENFRVISRFKLRANFEENRIVFIPSERILTRDTHEIDRGLFPEKTKSEIFQEQYEQQINDGSSL